MLPPRSSAVLPRMPVWLRTLGVGICVTPLVAALVDLIRTSHNVAEAIGGVVYFFVIYFVIVVLVAAPLLAPPVCWGLGWRPGALFSSVVLVLAGGIFLLVDDVSARQMGSLLLLHFPLLGVLAWEWRAVKRRQPQTTESS